MTTDDTKCYVCSEDDSLAQSRSVARCGCVVRLCFASAGCVRESKFWQSGARGCPSFFVHTSYVLMGSLERLQSDAGSNWQLVAGFWCRRFFRIYPLSILFVVLIAIFSIPGEPGRLRVAWLEGFSFEPGADAEPDLRLQHSGRSVDPAARGADVCDAAGALFCSARQRRYVSLGLWVGSVVLAFALPAISERLDVFRYGPCFTSGIVAYDLIRSKSWRWSCRRGCGRWGLRLQFYCLGRTTICTLGRRSSGPGGVAAAGCAVCERSGGIVRCAAACAALDRRAFVWNLSEPYDCDGVRVFHAVGGADVGAIIVLVVGSIGVPALLCGEDGGVDDAAAEELRSSRSVCTAAALPPEDAGDPDVGAGVR